MFKMMLIRFSVSVTHFFLLSLSLSAIDLCTDGTFEDLLQYAMNMKN